ncbi:transmembrane amino acid transporter protein-domain-containing protein [Aspergillus cavernicola]|uniref:Transmembrane amino acid transporter protein-domain-containing protein n=1 Tax=Aspergillus cavernicola TaxID=176166 RepID=A0ABR4ICP0_9EURO
MKVSPLPAPPPQQPEPAVDKISLASASLDPSVEKCAVEDNEVFRKTTDGVDFRTVGWVKASSIFLKVMFAVGVLSIPQSMYTLGAIGGSLSVLVWGAFNTYTGLILGNFREAHPRCHSIADMAYLVGGVVVKEICGFLFIVAYIGGAGAGIIGVATGLNALSHHAACTVYWAVIATVVIACAASIRRLQALGWLTLAGFASIYIAVFIVVVAVTLRSRPAAAPQTGDFELGYHVLAYPSFAAGMVASSTIFYSSCATSAFLPVVSEMKNPKDYRKALFTCMGIVTVSYLCFSLVVYRWCGKWVASPSLGSAGQTIKMVAYGIGLLGLIVSACLYIHIASKYIFVRILRNSRHLQSNTAIHWITWLGCTSSTSAIAFVFSQGVPVFNFVTALIGSVCFGPIAIILPGWLWIYDHSQYRTSGTLRQKVVYWLHVALIPLGAFVTIGGTYGVGLQIRDAYSSGVIGSAFSCADNSNSS